MSPLNSQQKIDMGLMSENQFGPLGDNGNPNRLKPKAWLWSPKHQIKNNFSSPHLKKKRRSHKEEGDLVEEIH